MNDATFTSDTAVQALAALAQETRLGIFRRLVAAGPGGLPAGDIAASLGVPANTLSFHLAQLAQAALVTATREGRMIRYRADFPRMAELIGFLLADCCGGRPEICLPLGIAPTVPESADEAPARSCCG